MPECYQTARQGLICLLLLPLPPLAAAEEEIQVLEEVIVTAQKREENVQDIPLTINVVNGDALDSYAIRNANDLADAVPGLTIQHTPQNLSNVTIRGLGTGAGGEAIDQSVGLFIDGIFAGRIREFQAALFDVERVEVIKGTQTSLLGKNTSLGAVSIVSRRPGNNFGGYIQGDYEVEFGSTYLTGAVDIPGWAGNYRIAFNHVAEQGYVENTATGNDVPERDQSTARLSAEYDIGDNGVLWLSYLYDDLEVMGDTFQADEDELGLLATMDPDADIGIDQNKHARTSYTENGDAFDEQTSHRAVINYQHRFGTYDFTSLSGWSEYDNFRVTDSDFLSVDYLTTTFDSEYRQFSQEFRLASPAADRFNYVVGMYYLNGEMDYASLTDLAFEPPFTIGPLLLNHASRKTYSQDTTVWSLFGQGTLDIGDKLRLTLGARYTDEEKEAVWGNEVLRTTPPINLLLAPETPPTPLQRDEDNTDGSINLQYDFDSQLMLYASWARGSKSGGFTTQVDVPEDAEYETEVAETSELGFKFNTNGGAGLVNASVFYTEIDDFQVVTFVGDGFLTETIQARSKGVELETLWALGRGVTLGASATYADAEEPDTGLRLPQAPELTMAINARYDYSLPQSGLRLRIEGMANYRDEQYNQRGELRSAYNDSLTLVDLRIALSSATDSWELALLGRNLLDEQSSFRFEFPIFGTEGTTIGSLNRPRTLALQGRYNF